MKVLKPLCLGMLTRPFTVRGQARLGVNVLMMIPLRGPLALLSEQELWQVVPRALGDDPILDEGVPKSRAEVLLAGRAFPPRRPATTCPIELRLGGIVKAASVVGDRRWERGVPTAPEPFDAMPLTWSRAFGGPGYEANPVGVGVMEATREDGTRIHRLPNVERAGRLLRSPDERPEPVGFGRIDITWRERMRHRGTYDQAWLEARYPGFADDLDWRFFNLASEDQQQDAPFAGDEPYHLLNLHPEHARLEGRLPGLRARAFAIRGAVGAASEGRPEGPLEEIATRLMTVWFFPEHERAVLGFAGTLEVSEDDARDVRLLMIAAERVGKPRHLEHYDAVVDRRYDKESGAIEALMDADLAPEDLPGPLPSSLPGLESRNLFRDNQRRARDRRIAEAGELAEQHGTSLEELGIELSTQDLDEPPELRALPALLREKQRELEARKAELAEKGEEKLREMRELCERMGVDFTPIAEAHKKPGGGPPPFTADGERAKLREMAERAAQAGSPLPHVEEMAEDPAQYAQWQADEARLRDLYRNAAHEQSPAARLTREESADARAEVEAAAREGRSLAGRDLTGVDLSGLSLAGIDLTGALLESCSLAFAVLDGACLERAVLAHADLTALSARGARFVSANLGDATLTRADLEDADLSGAILVRTDGRDARLTRVRFAEALLLYARLARADLSGAVAQSLFFVEVELDGASLVGADLTKSTFVTCSAREADFSDAVLRETNFVTGQLEGAKFLRAEAPNLRLVHGTSAPRADFRHARMPGANLRAVDLTGADLSGTVLDAADLSEARLEGAKIFRARARRSMWMRADLRGATLMHADLLEAFLTKADLRGADLRSASLYGADLAMVHGDDATQLDGANQGRVRVRPLRPSP